MKKKIFLLVTLFLLVIMCVVSCKGKYAKDEIVKYCEAMKRFDYQEMAKLTGKELDTMDMSTFDNKYVKEIFNNIKSNAKKIKYKIEEEKVEDGIAYVKVKFEYIDLSYAFGQAFADLLKQSLALAFSGETDEDKMTKVFIDLFMKHVKNNKEEKKEKTIEFTCTNDNSKWVISSLDMKEMLDVISGGITSALSNLSNIFSK